MSQQPPTEPSYTVLIVPERGEDVQRLKVQASHLGLLKRLSKYNPAHLRTLALIGGGLAVALLSTAAGFTWHYFQVVSRVQENTTLREENLELKARLANIKERVAHINDTLARVKHLNANLQNITRLSDPDRQLASDFEPDPREGMDPVRLDQELDKLTAEASTQEETLQTLTGYFEDRQALLASAPSIWPVRGWITSDFGYRLDPFTAQHRGHHGMDIANAPGTPIVAPADGTVVYSALGAGYGNVVVIDHGNGIKTRYGHLKKSEVRVGERIKRGQQIAQLGNTGRSTGPHLHYEVRINGVPENPRKFILETDDPGDPQRSLFSTRGGSHLGMGGD